MSNQHSQEWIDSACKACDGLTLDHFNGGWTALGLSRYAKSMERELAAVRDLLREVVIDIPGNHSDSLTNRICSYLEACERLGRSNGVT